jgi:large subunit ribosomal protein L13
MDAKGVILGHLASAVARLLMGKHKPIFHPAADCGDYVVVTNCAETKLLGQQWMQPQDGGRVVYSHSGYPGGLKTTGIHEYLGKDPSFVSGWDLIYCRL